MPNKAFNILTNVFSVYKVTKSELKIIQCLLYGYSNSVIAAHLKLTEGTVKVALSSIYKKTGVKSRAEFITRFHSQFEQANCEALMAPRLKALESQIEQYRVNARTADQIKACWPAFLKLVNIKPNSNLASQMLDCLLIALHLK